MADPAGVSKRFSVALLLLAALVAPRPAQADPINITSGRLDLHPSYGPIVLSGDRGFSFSSGVDGAGGFINAWMQCNGDPAHCTPGHALDLGASWTGNDITGQATLGGVVYPNVGGMNSLSSISVHFGGTAVLPPLSGSSAAISAPFLFNGSFLHPLGDSLVSDALIGHGIATLTMMPSPGMPGSWYLEGLHYSFEDPSPAPTPEPGTLLLLGTGLIGLAAVVRRARKPPAP
jgi:hypothetical protein